MNNDTLSNQTHPNSCHSFDGRTGTGVGLAESPATAAHPKRGRGRPPDRQRREMVARLRSRGLSLRQIGELLGITPQAVQQLLDAIGFPRMRVRNPRNTRSPRTLMSLEQVLKCADTDGRDQDRPPSADSGPVPDSGGESWISVDGALCGQGCPL